MVGSWRDPTLLLLDLGLQSSHKLTWYLTPLLSLSFMEWLFPLLYSSFTGSVEEEAGRWNNSALMPPPTTAHSIGHCSQPLKDSVAWSAETVESLPHLRGVLSACPRAISPSSPLLPGVKISSDITTHCSALAVWKNKITGWSAKQAGESGKDRGRRDKILNLPSAPKCLVRLIYAKLIEKMTLTTQSRP